MTGSKAQVFIRNALTGEYAYVEEDAHILMKVETHNHPTAISPFPVRRPVRVVKFAMKAQRVEVLQPKPV